MVQGNHRGGLCRIGIMPNSRNPRVCVNKVDCRAVRHTCCNEGLCGTADIMAADLPHPGLGYSLIAVCFP